MAEIGHGFQSNMTAVRVLAREIAPMGDEHDQTVAQELSSELGQILGDLPEADGIPEGVIRIRVTPNDNQLPEDKTKEKTRSITLSGEKGAAFTKTMQSFNRRAPIQGQLLRDGALIMLTSFLELLISDLLHSYYGRYPNSLPADSRTLTLTELRDLGSVEEAERFLTAREVDSLLRQSLTEQLEYFMKRLGVNLDPIAELRELVNEVSQRRNLLVHSGAVVNRYYLRNVKPELAKRFHAVEGKPLPTTPEYLNSAIDETQALGSILLQQCWRKWAKAHVAEAEDHLVENVYEALVAERYDFVKLMAPYVNGLKGGTDQGRRFLLINSAIAFKRSGAVKEMNELLQSVDWTACATIFHVALAVLRDDEEEIYRLLPKAIAAGEIGQAQLDEWPIFSFCRDFDRFQEFRQRHFGADGIESGAQTR